MAFGTAGSGGNRLKTILIVEDDRDLNEAVKLTLESANINTKQAFTIKQAWEKADSDIDLILLDINLPDGSGMDFCMRVRRKINIPIIFITANDTEYDMVKGLELGGDDYITKPFTSMVLRARVSAVLRRYEPDTGYNIYIDDYCFDFENMIFLKGKDKILLSKTEQKLLKILVVNKGNILSKDQLIDFIWTDEAESVEENALVVTVRRLRRKLEQDSKGVQFIQNVYGIGYTWKNKE
jgi:two-component system response regulator RegX3